MALTESYLSPPKEITIRNPAKRREKKETEAAKAEVKEKLKDNSYKNLST